MLALVGSKVWYRNVGDGVLHCERCGGDRPYRRRSGRRWAHVFGIPLACVGETGEHLRCTICHTTYRVELLAVPTVDQMRAALFAGTKAAVLEMLKAGGAGSHAARLRGIEMIRAAGAPDYHDGRILAALAGLDDGSEADGLAPGLRPALEAFAIQLENHASEWFLARVVEVGLADGPLTDDERDVAGTVASYLGMSKAQGRDVITLAEEAAQA